MRKFPWVIYFVVLVLIGIVAMSPVASVIVAGWIANTHGCRLDEGSVHPCVIGGKDYGQLLYALGVLGWLMLVTLPAGLVVAIIWLLVLLVHLSRFRKRLARESLGTLGSDPR